MEESAREIWRLANELVDQNYPPQGLYELLQWEDGFPDADIERRLTKFRETSAYIELAKLQRPLMSTDLARFRQLANPNIDYAQGIRPRTELELPRLREFAAEIQSIIDDEYR